MVKRTLMRLLLLGLTAWFVLPGAANAASPSLIASGNYSSKVGSVVIPSGTVHSGNIQLSAGNVVVRGTQLGNVTVSMGQVEVSGHVTGNVSVSMGEIILAHGARIDGSTTVTMGNIRSLPAGAALPAPQIGPQESTVVNVPAPVIFPTLSIPGAFPAWFSPFSFWGSLGFALAARVLWWLVSLATVLILASAMPRGLRILEQDLVQAPFTGFAWGLLIMLAAAPASIILMITIVGIPLALALWLALFVAKVLGYATVSILLGRWILQRFDAHSPSTGLMALVGTAVFLLVGSVPLVDIPLEFVVSAIGIGIVARTGFATGRTWFRGPKPAAP